MSPRQHESLQVPQPAGGALQVYLSHPGQPSETAVVYVHGFASNCSGEKAKAVEEACARRGWTYAAFDFRGHGQSSGSLLDLRGSSLLDDLDLVRSWLASRGVERLCLYGSSMGGWASAWYAVRRPETVAACALVAPAFHFLRFRWDRMSFEERRQWRESGRLKIRNEWVDVEIGAGVLNEMDQFEVGDLASRLACPLLILHGVLDDTVPFTHSLAFLETARHPDIELRLYKDGDHRLLKYKDAMAEAACGFFGRVLSEAHA